MIDHLNELRALGWSVAVHNDYRLGGKPHTFWLLTHPNGRWIKGEGETDAEALAAARASATPFYPPLMVDPMQNREGADDRLRQSYVTQQKFVPDQTALVFRADLGTWLHQLTRLRALVDIFRREDRRAQATEFVLALIAAAGEAKASALLALTAYPPPPWPPGPGANARREGWEHYFQGKPHTACPFPPDREDLKRGYLRGWDAAAIAAAGAKAPETTTCHQCGMVHLASERCRDCC